MVGSGGEACRRLRLAKASRQRTSVMSPIDNDCFGAFSKPVIYKNGELLYGEKGRPACQCDMEREITRRSGTPGLGRTASAHTEGYGHNDS